MTRPASAEFRFRPCPAAGFFLALALGAAPASARAEAELKTVAPAPVPRAKTDALRTYVNLRAGLAAQSTGAGRANLCLEAAPLDRFSIEACGNGSGFLDDRPAPEIAHFRAYWKAAWFTKEKYVITPRVGAGFAELQVGEDTPGFRFTGTDARGASTAGPEGVASLQMRRPVGAGFEFVGDLQAGAAYLAHAPELARPSAEVQPFAALTLGMGW